MRTQVRSLLLGNILFWGITMSVNTEPASAWFGWKTIYLGRLGVAANSAYSGGSTPIPPWDGNKLCRWYYGKSDAYGRAVSWFGSGNWQTDCYQNVPTKVAY